MFSSEQQNSNSYEDVSKELEEFGYTIEQKPDPNQKHIILLIYWVNHGEWICLKCENKLDEPLTIKRTREQLSNYLGNPICDLSLRIGQIDVNLEKLDIEPLILNDFIFLQTNPYHRGSLTEKKDIEIKIQVMHSKQAPFTVRCNNQLTVKELKQIIQDKKGYKIGEQELTLSDYTMYDIMKLSDYNVQDQSIIRLFRAYATLLKEDKNEDVGTTLSIRLHCFEYPVSVTCDRNMTIEELKIKLTKELNFEKKIKELCVNGTLISRDQDAIKLSDLKIENDDIICYAIIEIFVKSTTGKTFIIFISAYDTVSSLKKRIQEKEGTPVPHQRLIFAGKQLEHDRTLADHNIQHECTIHMVLRMRGGGENQPTLAQFVDLSDESKMREIPFVTIAPEWRAACYGLNLEGVCQNDKCKAYKEMVIVHAGFGLLNLLGGTIRYCPCCNKRVKCVTCAFVDCEWKFAGIILRDGNDREEYIQKENWTKVGHSYNRFDLKREIGDKGAKLVNYKKLIIETRRICKNEKCSLCSEPMGDNDTIVTPCKHKFHGYCLNRWKTIGNILCPLCRKNLNIGQ